MNSFETLNQATPGLLKKRTDGRAGWNGALVLGSLLVLSSFDLIAAPSQAISPAASGNFCTATADSQLTACGNSARADYFVSKADCTNISDATARGVCQQERTPSLSEDNALCEAQHGARVTACGTLGEARYDPPIDPANFVDPAAIGKSVAANPNLILTQGYTRIYDLNGDAITVQVTNGTKVINGVKCAIVHDFHTHKGKVVEDTEDYMVQDLSGNVWYFGELTTAFARGELPSSAGSFIAGIDEAKPGILMRATLNIGAAYREEFSLKGGAEDIAEIVSTTASESAPAASCAGNCLETMNTTGVEPGVVEHKFYLPGVGELVSFDGDGSDPAEREVLVQYHY